MALHDWSNAITAKLALVATLKYQNVQKLLSINLTLSSPRLPLSSSFVLISVSGASSLKVYTSLFIVLVKTLIFVVCTRIFISLKRHIKSGQTINSFNQFSLRMKFFFWRVNLLSNCLVYLLTYLLTDHRFLRYGRVRVNASMYVFNSVSTRSQVECSAVCQKTPECRSVNIGRCQTAPSTSHCVKGPVICQLLLVSIESVNLAQQLTMDDNWDWFYWPDWPFR